MNPFSCLKRIFQSRKPGPPVLLSIRPPRSGERTMLGVENMLQSIAVPEPFSLELTGDADGVRILVRCQDARAIRRQVSAHYPQAMIEELPPDDDPLAVGEEQEAWTMPLRSSGPDHVPLRQFRDDDLVHQGSDPMLAVIGALSKLRSGERVVSRILLRSLGPLWSAGYQEETNRRESYRSAETEQARVNQSEVVRMVMLAILAFVGINAWRFWQQGDVFKAAAVVGGAVFVLLTVGVLWAKFKSRGPRYFDPQMVKEKVGRTAFQAQFQVTAIVPIRSGKRRAKDLLGDVATAYRHYDNSAGAHVVVGKMRPAAEKVSLHPPGPGLFGKRSILGVRELASLWHPPSPSDETPPVERSGSRLLAPPAHAVRDGAYVGIADADKDSIIRFPDDLLRRHHLYVARTRMGKSTLMQHIVADRMAEKAAGLNDDAIVVIDPHADLVAALLEHVPDSLVDQVRLIDLADPNGAPGINLLDTRVFTDRDRTADSVVRIARGLWDQWGPRMQSILEQVVKTLHEVNEHRDPEMQYTILDGLRLLSDENEHFRNDVLAQVNDVHLLAWWKRDFGNWHRNYRMEALAPVQTRLSYYSTSRRARAILGQRRSTIDVRRTIHDGGILLVSTAQGVAGRDTSALVGASVLNLVDAVIREQGAQRFSDRRGVLVVVDEMQSMPGVDYESMLSELGKFGASFILATQSLATLGDLSDSMRDSLLANVGCLAVFQVAGSDARQLVPELGSDRVNVDDITSLPVHHCYVRATIGTERVPAFSMEVRKPEQGDVEVADRIREETINYTTPHESLLAQDSDIDHAVEEFRESVRTRQNAAGEQPPTNARPQRRRARSRKRKEQSEEETGTEPEAEVSA